MTKMATMAINNKILKNLLIQNQEAYDFKTWHEALRNDGEVYKICINNDPGMTVTYFTVAYAFKWGKFLKCHLKGKTCSKLANGLKFDDLKRH